MKSYLELLRPHQWIKNLMLLFPPFLGGVLPRIDSLPALLLPLFSFSAGASCIYVVNDLLDAGQDIHHPGKCQRPIPSGRIRPAAAWILAALLGVSAIASGLFISGGFFIYLLTYLGLSIGYSIYLKTVPIVELFCVVSGFLLRLQAGGSAYGVRISDWLFLSVFLLALFLVSGKRLSELRHVGGVRPELVRPVLMQYPQGFFEGCLFITGASALVTYTLYVIGHKGNVMVVPLCCFGLLAYLRRVFSGRGGDPTRALLKDPQLFFVGVVWTILVAVDVYWKFAARS